MNRLIDNSIASETLMTLMSNEKALQSLILERDRRLIQNGGFIPYCQIYCRNNDLVMAKHHLLMCRKLEKAMTTPNYRLMIKMPPGHAKSTYASILAPSYYLGMFPKKIVIMTTHTQDFSDDWGRTCRRIIADEEYQYFFKTGLMKDSSAASRFDLKNGSKYFGAGILGNITGKRANILIGDDWLRGIKDADSEVIRESIWKAYIWDLRTRLSPGGSIVLIGTPWHEDDHFGRILLSKDKDKWDVIELPALAKENDPLDRSLGQPLWPEYITLDMLTDIRDSLDKEDIRMWNSLYQVSPTLEEGNYFQKDWMQRLNHLPNTKLEYYGASDYAVSDGKGDYTVHGVVGYDSKNDDIYIVKVWRERTTSDIWIDQFIDMALDYETTIWAEESGQILKSLEPFIIKRMNDRKTYIYREQFSSATDKTSRARAIQAYMAQKKVYILNDAWTDDFVKELLSFPSGKNDDQVDFISLIGRLLRNMRMRVEKAPKKSEYGYESGKIILPGISDVISKNKGGYRRI